MNNLHRLGFVEALNETVRREGRPILGICLGLQAMAMHSLEGGRNAGLGWFDAEVTRLDPCDPNARVPHVGWNEVSFLKEHDLFAGLPPSPDLYFVHSYTMRCRQEEDIVATCRHGHEIVTAAVCRANVCATQFHPEKSQDFGIRILQNFVNWKP
jgi:glutamine amidotransferase